MESEPTLTPSGKYRPPEAQRTIEPTTLQHAGQRAQHSTDALPQGHQSGREVNTASLDFSSLQSSGKLEQEEIRGQRGECKRVKANREKRKQGAGRRRLNGPTSWANLGKVSGSSLDRAVSRDWLDDRGSSTYQQCCLTEERRHTAKSMVDAEARRFQRLLAHRPIDVEH